jgi:hypothetical protein
MYIVSNIPLPSSIRFQKLRRSPAQSWILILTVVLAVFFVFPASSLAESLLLDVVSIFKFEGSGDVVPVSSNNNLINLIADFIILPHLALVIINIRYIISGESTPIWVIGWTIVVGLLSFIGASLVIFGRIFPLTPNRLLIIITPLLTGSALYLIHTNTFSFNKKTISNIIIILLIITNLAGIGTETVLYSNQSDNSLGGHYTPNLFESSNWLKKYKPEATVYGYEPEIWQKSNIKKFRLIYNVNYSDINGAEANICVHRFGIDSEELKFSNNIYTSRDVGLYTCEPSVLEASLG